MIQAGLIRINDLEHLVTVSGTEIHLTATEYNLLLYLALHPGWVISEAELLERVWGYETNVFTGTVKTNIKRLRHKLKPGGNMIKNVRTFGYKLVTSC